MPKKTENLLKRKFDRLRVIAEAPRRHKKRIWKCRCRCGNISFVDHYKLISGRTLSCGCLARELLSKRKRTHGHSYEKSQTAYGVWLAIRKRCLCPNHHAYHQYGGRGITICKRWVLFENFLADMGPRPSPQHSIDRKDNNGNYTPKNCRWATAAQQGCNKRTNRIICIDGKSLTLSQWAMRTGIPYATIQARLNRGWSVDMSIAHIDGRKDRSR